MQSSIITAFFDTSLFDPDTKSINVRSWLNAEESGAVIII